MTHRSQKERRLLRDSRSQITDTVSQNAESQTGPDRYAYGWLFVRPFV